MDKIILTKDKIISYKNDDNLLIKTGEVDIEFTNDALNELVNDSYQLGLITPITLVVKNEKPKNETIVKEEEESIVNEIKPKESNIEEVKNLEKLEISKDIKKRFLNKKNIVLILFCFYILINIILTSFIIFNNNNDDKNVIKIIQNEYGFNDNRSDTLTIGVNKENIDIIDNHIKKITSTKISYGMWPILKENGFDLYINNSLEFDNKSLIPNYYYAVCGVYIDLKSASNKVHELKKIGYNNADILLKNPDNFNQKKFLVYSKKSSNKDSIFNSSVNSTENIKFIQFIIK